MDSVRTSADDAGRKAGYESARPSSAPDPAGPLKGVAWFVAVLGMAKIVGSLVVFVILLIVDSSSASERIAKTLATALAALVVFWAASSLKITSSADLFDILVIRGSDIRGVKLLVGLCSAGVLYFSLSALEQMLLSTEGQAALQTFLVFVAAAAITVLLPCFGLVLSAPSISGYLFFDIVLGVVLGGVFWLVARLLSETTATASATGRRARYARMFSVAEATGPARRTR